MRPPAISVPPGSAPTARRIDADQARIAQRRQQTRAAAKLEHRQPVARTHRRAQRFHLPAHPLELVGCDRMRGIHRDHHCHPLRRRLDRQAQAGEQCHQYHEQTPRATPPRPRRPRAAPRARLSGPALLPAARRAAATALRAVQTSRALQRIALRVSSADSTSIAASAKKMSHSAIGITWTAAAVATTDAVRGRGRGRRWPAPTARPRCPIRRRRSSWRRSRPWGPPN